MRRLKQTPISKFSCIPKLITCHYAADFQIADFPVFIEREVAEYGLILNPDFQRGHVWTESQQISYVEYLLRGGRSARDVYLNNPELENPITSGAYNDYVCVDGLQRIQSIQRFINNEIPCFGTLYRDYEDRLPPRVTVRVNINDFKSKGEVLIWYLEINAGGTPHDPQELDRVKALLEMEKGK